MVLNLDGYLEFFTEYWILCCFLLILLIALALPGSKRHADQIDSYEFPKGIITNLAEKYPQLSADTIAEVLQQLREYFHLCNIAMAPGLDDEQATMVAMPSKIVDEAWHEFILFTKEYEYFCRQVFGKFLHHMPATSMTNQSEVSNSLKNAWRLACMRKEIDPIKPNAIPPLFSIDEICNISEGNRYVRDESIDTRGFPVSRIKCNGHGGSCCGGLFGGSGTGGGGCGGH